MGRLARNTRDQAFVVRGAFLRRGVTATAGATAGTVPGARSTLTL